MKTTRLTAALAALALAVPLGFAALGQEGSRPSTPGRYLPMAPGVLDSSSGAYYYVDPSNSEEMVTIDLPGCRALVRPVAKDASGWGAVELPKMDPAVVPSRASTFVPLGGNAPGTFNGVVDTRTGAIYTYDLSEGKVLGRTADWKGVRVVRLDPVLGTRTVRELVVSKRGS